MKKILSIALVALLAASAVFAGITGSASFSSGYDLDENVFSLSNPKSSDSTFSFEFDASTAGTEAPESGIYADFSGSVTANMTEDGLSVKADLKDALIKSTDGLWSVNLTKVANGVEVTYAGFASEVYYKNKLNWGAKLTTPEYAIIEGLTVSGNISYDVAANDFTDPANWSKKIYVDGVEEAIAKAKNTKEYFLQHDDGTYYNATLAAKQKAVADAEKALEEAKAKFAAKPEDVALYKAIESKTKDLAKKEKALASAIAGLEYQFMADHADEDGWYEASTTYEASSYYSVEDQTRNDNYFSTETIEAKAKLITGAGYSVTKDKTYYVLEGDAQIKEASLYNPGSDNSVVYTFVADETTTVYVYKVSQNEKITTYSEKASLYKYGPVVADKKTVAGGLKIAYAKDLFAA
ncbi:MAG: hypothetical protein ACI4M4_00585, partial [Candidatus Ornithospirochaeta sp.]